MLINLRRPYYKILFIIFVLMTVGIIYKATLKKHRKPLHQDLNTNSEHFSDYKGSNFGRTRKHISHASIPLSSSSGFIDKIRRVSDITTLIRYFKSTFKSSPITDKDRMKNRVDKAKPFEVFINAKERTQMYDLLQYFDKLMKSNVITYFMYGGTLLGSFRHHDLIPWDDDLDLIANNSDRAKVISLLKANTNPLYSYIETGKIKIFRTDGNQSSVFPWKWPYIDLFFFRENETFIIDTAQTYFRDYAYTKSLVLPLHSRPLGPLQLPAPRDTFEFLRETYSNTEYCYMGGYAHSIEGKGPHGKVKCKDLKHKFPFVEHISMGITFGMKEILKLDNHTIHEKIVSEPGTVECDTFELFEKRK